MCKTPVQYQDTPRVAAQSAASACELSPGISVTFASATPADTLRLISTNLTNMYIRAGFSEQRVNLLLSQFGQFTCSRRLCTAGFTFQTVALTCKEFFFFSLSLHLRLRGALAFIMNVLSVALGYAAASLQTPRGEQEQSSWHSQTVHCRRTEALTLCCPLRRDTFCSLHLVFILCLRAGTLG